MECTIATLIACFSWANLYLDAGLAYQDVGVIAYKEELEVTYFPDADTPFETREVLSKENFRMNPYGTLAIGYEINFGNTSIDFRAGHSSSLATGRDRGVNSVGLRLRWYPFSRARR